MIDDDVIGNPISRKRPFNQACRAENAQRGKSIPFYPAIQHHQQHHTKCRSYSSPRIEVIPTADDYANLVFYDTDDEDHIREECAVEDKPITKARIESFDNKRRRVSFSSSSPTVHHISDLPKVHTMTLEEKCRQWLTSNELEEVKSSAQTTIQHMRILAKGIHDMPNFRKMMITLEKETSNSIRGLEHRVFRRKKTRQSLIRDVLECQTHIKGLAKFDNGIMEEESKMNLLANISTKGSSMAVDLAISNAKEDFDEVYFNRRHETRKSISLSLKRQKVSMAAELL